MAASTKALQLLDRAGVEYRLHRYETDVLPGHDYGLAVARSLGQEPERLFKTLVAEVDGEAVVAVVPTTLRLSPKRLAKAASGKKAQLMAPNVAERLTGYVTGGISPLGQKKRLRTFLDESVLLFETVFVSAGRRGLQIELPPEALIELTAGEVFDLAR